MLCTALLDKGGEYIGPVPACLSSQGDGCGEGRSLGPHVHSLTYLRKSLTSGSVLTLYGAVFPLVALIVLC